MKYHLIEYRGINIVEPDILMDVIKQINKDISMSGMTDSFNHNSSLEKFAEEFTNWVIDKLENDDSQLLNFLYRVDVKQSLIRSDDGLPQENFVRRVLERELQKVVLRRQFSSSGDKLDW